MSGQGEPSPEDKRAALERVLGSNAFAGARRSRDLLRFLVAAVLEGRADQIKEYTVGADALGRGEGFDPRFDSIARVEASRLRSRLALYYATEGRTDRVVIALPTGGYVPAIASADPSAAAPPAKDGAASSPLSFRRSRLGLGLGAVLLAALVAAGFGLWPRKSPTPPSPVAAPLRLEAALGAPGEVWINPGVNLALSRDGRLLVMSIRRPDGAIRLYVRKMDELDARELPGTDDASSPFLSPDGRWVAFFSGGALKKTLVDGHGSPITLASGALAFSGGWSDAGDIVATLTNDGRLWRIPEDGGKPVPIATFGAKDPWPRWPSVLPGGKGILYTAAPDGFIGSIDAMRMDGSGRRTLVSRGANARYVSGYLLYTDGPQLFAARFDADRLALLGPPQKIVDDIAYLEFFGIAPYTVSDDGTLVYVRGGTGGLSTIEQIDASGQSRVLVSQPGRRFFPRLSPDGKQLIFTQADGVDYSLWRYDMGTGVVAKFATESSRATAPAWSPDGRYVFYLQGAIRGLAVRRADGAGEAQTVLENVPGNFWSVSPDGKAIAFQISAGDRQLDIWTVPIESGAAGFRAGQPSHLVGKSHSETQPTFSPDGAWLAYSSNEAGEADVYVYGFRDKTAVQVSPGPGSQTRWSKDGRLFYETRDRLVMSMRYRAERGRLTFDQPAPWSTRRLANTNVFPNFDLMPDGKSIVAMVPVGDDTSQSRDHITVMRNVFDRLAPVGSKAIAGTTAQAQP